MALPVGVTRLGSFKGERGRPGTFDDAFAIPVPADTSDIKPIISGPEGQYVTIKVPRGLPGVNALENDAAIATYMGAPDADTYKAVANRLDSYRRGVPAYVTAAGATHTVEYDPYLRLFYESSNDLRDIRTNIAFAKEGLIRTNVLFIGDSKTEGKGAGFVNSLPATFLQTMGAKDGMAYAAHALAQAPDGRWSGITGFTATGANFHLNAATGANTATIQFGRRSTGLRLWYYSTATLSSSSVSIDGGAGVPVSPAGTQTPPGATGGYYYMDFTGLAETNHSLALSINVTSGAFYFLGVEALHSSLGLTVTNAGLSASTIAGWVASSSSRLSLYNSSAGLMSQSSGRHIAIVQLGTNSSVGEVANYQAIVTNLRTIGFKVLLVVPGGTTTSSGDRVTMKRATYDTAASLAMPLIDFTDLIGNTIAMDRGYMDDALHENTRGYNYEASALKRILSTA